MKQLGRGCQLVRRGTGWDRGSVRENVAKGVASAAVVVGAAARELAVLGSEAGFDDVVGAAVGVLGEDGGREAGGGGEEEGLHFGGCGGDDDAFGRCCVRNERRW